MKVVCSSLVFLLSLCLALSAQRADADSISGNPIVFVTMVPNPNDFGTLAATFGNHVANPDTAFRGGDLWIRYADGSLKNLTAAAGYGNSGFQGAGAIAVRDPAVHWDGTKVIFSMVVGAPTQRYQLTNHRWQLYEIVNLGPSDTPTITKVSNQPSDYNNMSPAYGSDDSIIFTSDRPRDDTVLNTYPQRDEYESSPVNSGLWKLSPQTGVLELLDHSPSGDFNPIVDSFGRIIFTRWDHLQRDQQNVGVSFGAVNYASETSSTIVPGAPEVFPEPRSVNDPEYNSRINLFTINQFFPWMALQDGTELETLNHIGRQEIGVYSERSFNDDPNIQEFYGQYSTGQNTNDFDIFLHIKEMPTAAGTYVGTNCQEFGTHSSGQVISITGPPGLNPDAMQVEYLTHPDTAGATNSPSSNHTGLYRDAVPLVNGQLIASHTANTRQDSNIGTSSAPLSRYDFRLKLLTKSGSYFQPSTLLTSGISKSVSFWNPDNLISYSGLLWEMMAVELVSRSRPAASTAPFPSVEAGVLASMGVNLSELQAYLRSQNLALVVSRNVTTRDRNDRQQPTNLRVKGTSTESIPHTGRVYDIAQLQFFQGDLIRGYNSGSGSGRRVLAQPMHSVQEGINPQSSDLVAGAVHIAQDGSTAAFVPARRALSWQLVDSDGTPVVRERYWLTFQPGEIRVCASCHGVNTADHLSQTAPTNAPLALAQLLAHWKNLPMPTPTPGSGDGNNGDYSLTVSGLPKLKPGRAFRLTASAAQEEDTLRVGATIAGTVCSKTKAFSKSRVLRGILPPLSGSEIEFSLYANGQSEAVASELIQITNTRRKNKKLSAQKSCRILISSLRASSKGSLNKR